MWYFSLSINSFLKFLLPVTFLSIVQVIFPLLAVNSLLFLDVGFSFI